MGDHHSIFKFPSLCSERTPRNNSVQSETELNQGGRWRLGRQTSLEFAENLTHRCKEKFDNPTESLHMLSLGLEAMKSTSPVAAILQALYICASLWLMKMKTTEWFAEPTQEKLFKDNRAHIGKKVPKEHSFKGYITSTSGEEEHDCCDAEGDAKTTNKDVKSSKGVQKSSRSSATIQQTASSNGTGCCRGNGGGDDDDDDDEKKKWKDIDGNECNLNIPIMEEDDAIADDDNDGENLLPISNCEPHGNDDIMHPGTDNTLHDHSQDNPLTDSKSAISDGGMAITKDNDTGNDICKEDKTLNGNDEDADDEDDNDDGSYAQLPLTSEKGALVEENRSNHILVNGEVDSDDGTNTGGGGGELSSTADKNALTSAAEGASRDMTQDNDGKNDNNGSSGGGTGEQCIDQVGPITQIEIDDLINDIKNHGCNATGATLPGIQLGNLHNDKPEHDPCIDSPERLSFPYRIVARGAPEVVHRKRQSEFQHEENHQERPQTSVLHPYNQDILSVNQGKYDEGFEWREAQEDKAYLGQGSSGKCYLCMDLKSNKLFAIKKIPRNKYDARELEVWAKVSGHNVRCLELYGASEVDNSILIFMEYMEGGSIAQLHGCKFKGGFDESSALYILREVIESLDFLHSQGIVHCDVKGENVFVNESLTKIKLGDYGAAVELSTLDYKEVLMRGTENFMSPEACRGEQINCSRDIWSAGCLLIQMLTGKPPWSNFSGSILYKIGSLKENPPLPNCSRPIRRLLQRMLAINPLDRPTAKALQQDSIFQQVVWQPCVGVEDVFPEGSAESVILDPTHGHPPHAPLSTREVIHLPESSTESVILDPTHGHPPHASLSTREVIHRKVGTEPGVEPSRDGVLKNDDDDIRRLESDLLFSLSLNGINGTVTMMMDAGTVDQETEVGPEANQELLFKVEKDDRDRSLPSLYSIEDLTKVEFYNADGELLVEIREKGSCTFGHLGKMLHPEFQKRSDSLGSFTFETELNTTVDARDSIGFSDLQIFVHSATGDSWRQKYSWRINPQGNIQLRHE